MSDAGLTIKIGSQADTRGFDQATDALKRSEAAAHDFVETLKLGVGINLGGKIVESIRDIPNILREAISQGVEFNSMMQSSGIAIAAGLRSVDQSLSFAEAKQKGSEALDLLKQKSLELGLDFESVVETFKVNVPTMWQAGIHDTQKMIDLMLLLNSVAAQKGISGYQAQRDIIDLLNGQAERTILGKELQANGVTQAALKAAQENGTIFELLTTKLAAYLQGMQAAAGTWAGVVNTFHTELNSLLGDLSKPLFDDLTEGIKKLSEELSSPEGKRGLRELGLDIRDLVHDGLSLTEWAVKNADTLVMLGGAAGTVGVAMAAMKINNVVQGFISLSTRVSANTALLAENTAVVRAHTAAMEADTAANIANAESGAAVGAGAAAGGGGVAVGAAAAAGGGAGYVVRNAATGVAQRIVPVEAGAAVAGEEAAAVAAGSAAATGGAVAATSAFGSLGTALSGLVTLAAEAAPWVLALGAAYETFTHLPASIGYGKLTTAHDLELAEGVTKDSKLPEFSRQGQQIASVADQNKLLSAMDDYTDELIARRAGLGLDESAQKDVITQEIKMATELEKKIQTISLDTLRSNEVVKKQKEQAEAAKEAAAKKAEQESKNEEENKKRAEARAEQRAAHQMQLDNELAVQLATQAAERGEYSPAIAARLASLDAQASANPRIDDPKADPKLVASRDKINDAIDSSKESLHKEQERLSLAAWKAQDRAAEDLRQKKMDSLKEQDALEEARGKKRVAELEASGKSENAIASERVRIEDEIATKRLSLQNQIGYLENESAAARETRQDVASAEKTSRDSRLNKRPDDTTRYSLERGLDGSVEKYIPLASKGQVLDSDVTKRKGYIEQHHSNLSDFIARQSPGALRHPWESLPLPGPAQNPSAVASAGISPATGGGDPSALSRSIDSGAARQLQAIQKAAASVDKAADHIANAVGSLSKKIDAAVARIDRMVRT